MYKRILQPVDLSESLTDIKIRVSFLEQTGREETILVHVLNSGLDTEDRARARLAHMADALEEVGVRVSIVLGFGHVASETARIALDKDADLIYLRGSRKNLLVRSLLGSTTEDVVRLTERPVLIHKDLPLLEKTETVHRAVFATDFHEAAERALPCVTGLGSFVTELILLHVGKQAADPETEQLRRNAVQIRLNELKEKCRDDFQRISLVSKVGRSAGHIVETVAETRAELVVLGQYNEPFPAQILGSTSTKVISRVQSSVLLVP